MLQQLLKAHYCCSYDAEIELLVLKDMSKNMMRLEWHNFGLCHEFLNEESYSLQEENDNISKSQVRLSQIFAWMRCIQR